jgi:hypothetical protein
VNLALMLELYRRAAVPFTVEAQQQLASMAPAVQAELLLYMIMDFASNKENPDAGTAPPTAPN